jgi:hypothetical protein
MASRSTRSPQRADDTGKALAKYMRVDLRRADIGMPQQGASKNVGKAASAIPMVAPQKQAKKRSLRAVNEHFDGGA